MKLYKLLLVLAVFMVSCNSTKNTTAVSQTTQPQKQVNTKNIQGGMWIPSMLKGMNENEMKLLGSHLTADDIYSVNQSSLKDAVIHFNGGCTAEIISPKGLVLTNHHCGYSAIQSHSSIDHDYLKDGFWAKNELDELPNPGMTVTFINRIEDVTQSVLQGVQEGMDVQLQEKLIYANIEKLKKNTKKEDWQSIMVKPIYKGNQYLLYVTTTYKDIRLVGAPPSSIGKFGADTDNWMWPRHTGDFSMFRIYADKNNKPASYSKDNVPYTPKHYLPISLDGVSEGDFTLVFGFPGRTNEYLPSVAVNQIVNVLNPAKINIRNQALKIVDGFMRKDQAIKIKYASKFASIANYWKKWIGESQGLKKSHAIEQKQELEKLFAEKVAQKDLVGYQSILSDFEQLYKDIEQVALARDYWIEVAYRNVELLNITFRAFQLEQVYKSRGEGAFETARTNLLKRYNGVFKNFSAKVDQPVFEKLVALYAKNVPENYVPDNLKENDVHTLTTAIFATTQLISLKGTEDLLSGSAEEVLRKLNDDSAYKFGKQLHEMFYQKIEPEYQAKNLKILDVQKKYMKALKELFPNKRFFPDANSTLRVTYGQVKGYEPRDAVYYEPVSYLKGVIEKYVPGDYEFDVPSKLLKLYKNKDFGDYGENGKMPVCFLGTNHTTGGNSGSPTIDAYGNLIGLNFDRVWEGTMSDYNYDAAICRNIMVDIRYVLFIIDKYAGAHNLIEEMKLVHPKK